MTIPNEPGHESPTAWRHCNPFLMISGFSCPSTPKRTCACLNGEGHDHLVDLHWSSRHPERAILR